MYILIISLYKEKSKIIFEIHELQNQNKTLFNIIHINITNKHD